MTDTDKQNKQINVVSLNHNMASMLDVTPTFLPAIYDNKITEKKTREKGFITISFITSVMVLSSLYTFFNYAELPNESLSDLCLGRIICVLYLLLDAYLIKEWIRVFLSRKK